MRTLSYFNWSPKRRGRATFRTSINLQAVVSLIASSILLTATVLLRVEAAGLSLQLLCAVATIHVGFSLLLAANLHPVGLWSTPSVYLIVFSLFHFGLVSVYGIGLLSQEKYQAVSYWFLSDRTPDAIYLAMQGANAYVCGLALTSIVIVNSGCRESRGNNGPDDVYRIDAYYLALIGFCMLVAGVALWLLVALVSGGPGIFIGSYRNYLDATAGQPLSYITFSVGLGLCLVTIDGSDRLRLLRRVAYVIFGIYALLAAPIGLRGEILIPLIAALTVRAMQGRRLSLKSTFVFGVILLVGIAFVKELRQVGMSDLGSSGAGANAFDALAEMGSSIRPTTDVIGWMQQGDPHIYGASYWAPFDRALCSVGLGSQCLPSQDDPRLMNVLIQERVGPVGFSPIAESFYNFGRLGVIGVMMFFGILLGWLSRWRVSPTSIAFLSVVLVPLLYNVRNAFVPVPAHIFLGIVLVSSSVLVGRVTLTRVDRLRRKKVFHSSGRAGVTPREAARQSHPAGANRRLAGNRYPAGRSAWTNQGRLYPSLTSLDETGK